MIQIRTLDHTSHETLFTAFSDAFSDYTRQWSDTEFYAMLRRRGYTPELSFGAFDQDKLVSFIFNAAGTYRQLPTVYDTGTGTIVAYRGQKLVPQLFQASLPALKAAGMQQYLLEVLQDNTKAINIYREAGFHISRSFDFFAAGMDDINTGRRSLAPGYELRDAAIRELQAFHDFVPAWQNSFEAINRCPECFTCLEAWHGAELAGYGILEPATGDLSQLAVHPQHRRKGVGTALLHGLSKKNKHTRIKVINTDTACSAMSAFLDSCDIPVNGNQYEMILQLA